MPARLPVSPAGRTFGRELTQPRTKSSRKSLRGIVRQGIFGRPMSAEPMTAIRLTRYSHGAG
jgi:hypothetical protein